MGVGEGKVVEIIPADHAKQKWISVKDRLPETREVVIGFLERPIYRLNYPHDEPMLFLFIEADGKWKRAYGAETVDYSPTHWMPLPEPPERDGE